MESINALTMLHIVVPFTYVLVAIEVFHGALAVLVIAVPET